jgi:hypothetical protein
MSPLSNNVIKTEQTSVAAPAGDRKLDLECRRKSIMTDGSFFWGYLGQIPLSEAEEV